MNEKIIFSGNSNKELATEVCNYLGIPLGKALITNFSDGETRIEIQETVRGKDVFLIQSTSNPANHHLMELLIFIDALKRASVQRITAIIPYFGYARQDRKVASRSPISAKLVADMLVTAGVDRVVSMDLHNGSIQGFFNIPLDHVYARPVFYEYFKNMENLMIVSPDAGGVERTRGLAKILKCEIAIIDKRRDEPNKSRVFNVVGDVRGKNCVLLDDIVDTAGTMCQAAAALKDAGANEVYGACTHGVLSGNAVDRIQDSCLKEFVVTNTIDVPYNNKIKVISVRGTIGEAIRRIHNSESMSQLFEMNQFFG